MFKKILPYIAGFFALAIIVLLFYSSLSEFTNSKILNFWFSIGDNQKSSDKIVIVAIDDKSIKNVTAWPWSRDIIANLTEKICECNPRVVAYDITFSHKENNPSQIKATDSLAKVALKYGNVTFPYFFYEEDRVDVISIKTPQLEIKNTGFKNISLPKNSTKYVLAKKLIPSSKKLTANNHAGGHINIRIEPDGYCRKEVQVLSYGGVLLPPLSLTVVKDYYNISSDNIVLHVDSGVTIGNKFIPIDETGCSLINFYKSNKAFAVYSALDLLNGEINPDKLKDKIVIVGVSANGISVIKRTPVLNNMPTVLKLATAIDNTLTGRWLKSGSLLKGLAFTIVLGILTIILAYYLPFLWLLLYCFIVSVIGLSVSYVAFTKYLIYLQVGSFIVVPWIILSVILITKKIIQK